MAKSKSDSKRYELCWESFAFDIEPGRVWRRSWGPKPDTPKERLTRFRAVLDAAPKVIPVMGHRFAFSAETKCTSIISVYGFDIISYGSDWVDYIKSEWFTAAPASWRAAPANQHFMSSLAPNVLHNQPAANGEMPLRLVPFWGELIFGELPLPTPASSADDEPADGSYDE